MQSKRLRQQVLDGHLVAGKGAQGRLEGLLGPPIDFEAWIDPWGLPSPSKTGARFVRCKTRCMTLGSIV